MGVRVVLIGSRKLVRPDADHDGSRGVAGVEPRHAQAEPARADDIPEDTRRAGIALKDDVHSAPPIFQDVNSASRSRM